MMQQQPPAKGEMLKRYTVDLTALAADGKLDPVIGRRSAASRPAAAGNGSLAAVVPE